jgi:predicted dehydrogenase
LGIIGCGAATEQRHLPAARVLPEVEVAALVDRDLARARRLARRYGVPLATDALPALEGQVDGVIVALPNHLHAPVAEAFLSRGVPVLVEKPLARTVAEATGVVEAARRAGVALQVGHMYRFSKAARLTRRLLRDGWLGPLRSFSAVFATVFGWPLASGFAWSREQAGGGILIDVGAHVLDLLLWWLGPVADVAYRDDNLGGVEAESQLTLTLEGPAGPVTGEVLLSRLRACGTYVRFVGERCSLQCGLSGSLAVRVWPSEGPWGEATLVADHGPGGPDSFRHMYVEQLRAFARAIREGPPAAVSGEDVLPSLALTERCYRERRPLVHPWMAPARVEVPA